MSKLTAQQEKFCQSIADGMSQADAYRASYKVGDSKAATVYETASKLAADPKIATRIAELKAALSEKALWTREQAVRALIEEATATGDRAKASDRIAALKALNDMHGYNAPVKSEVKHLLPRTIRLVALSGD